MQNLKIPKAKYTLEVNFNAETGILELSGSSYPENALDFFQPVFNWIKTYISKVRKAVVLNLKFNYLNTSSLKCILDILEIFENYNKEGGDAIVNWYCAKDDEDIHETGEEISEDIKLPFNIVLY